MLYISLDAVASIEKTDGFYLVKWMNAEGQCSKWFKSLSSAKGFVDGLSKGWGGKLSIEE